MISRRFPALLATLPVLFFFVLLEIILGITRSLWSPSAGYAPDFVLERQGGLLEIQRRVTEEAGTGGNLLDSERMYAEDRELFWRLHRNIDIDARNYLVPREWGDPHRFRIVTDGAGFRVTRADSAGRGSQRSITESPLLLCMGNSSTFGWGVDGDQTYAHRLGEMIEQKYGVGYAEVVNGGIPGYTSHQGRAVFEANIRRFRPRVAVLSYGFNDSRAAPTTDGDLTSARRSPVGRVSGALSRTQLWQFLSLQIRRDRTPPQAERTTSRVPVDQYGRNLAALIETARDAGIEPVILALVMPEAYRAVAIEVARETDVVLVDPMPSLMSLVQSLEKGGPPAGFDRSMLPPTYLESDHRTAVLADPIHPNELGHLVIATELLDALGRHGLLDQ